MESSSCISSADVGEVETSAQNPDFDLKTARWKDKLDKCIAKPPAVTLRQRAERMFQTPYIISIAVFFISLVLLVALRPPMVHTPGKQEMERGKLSVVRLLVWSLVAALLALFLPIVVKR